MNTYRQNVQNFQRVRRDDEFEFSSYWLRKFFIPDDEVLTYNNIGGALATFINVISPGSKIHFSTIRDPSKPYLGICGKMKDNYKIQVNLSKVLVELKDYESFTHFIDVSVGILLHEIAHQQYDDFREYQNRGHKAFFYNIIQDNVIEYRFYLDNPIYSLYIQKTLDNFWTNKFRPDSEQQSFLRYVYEYVRKEEAGVFSVRGVNVTKRLDALFGTKTLNLDSKIVEDMADKLEALYEEIFPEEKNQIDEEQKIATVFNEFLQQVEKDQQVEMVRGGQKSDTANLNELKKPIYDNNGKVVTIIHDPGRCTTRPDIAYSVVNRLTSVLGNKFNERDISYSGNKSGKLDRRLLSKAFVDENIFIREGKIIDEGLCIGLLLDSSGSMEGSKLRSAYKAACSIVKALDALRVDYLSYGYSTISHNEYDQNYMVYLGSNQDRDRMGNYLSMRHMSNVDNFAIDFICNKMLTEYGEKNKALIVLSDGLPCGNSHTKNDPVEDTRLVVEKYSRMGILIYQIGIDSVDSAMMFKHFCSFTDMQKLPSDMGNFVSSLIKKFSI